ncbi:hypothetical protein KCM76_22830 [Zooshikella marina]|uniref:hypothetical protein n=1 Tax=Zooshikella ganghwensis TaxID=202772 RepID=UPI001BB01806|nr:hypothetical protein [Zooshikella ganghwensis]MBU2708847.1 hypothetical protein [Zooshikella ganghwensis]
MSSMVKLIMMKECIDTATYTHFGIDLPYYNVDHALTCAFNTSSGYPCTSAFLKSEVSCRTDQDYTFFDKLLADKYVLDQLKQNLNRTEFNFCKARYDASLSLVEKACLLKPPPAWLLIKLSKFKLNEFELAFYMAAAISPSINKRTVIAISKQFKTPQSTTYQRINSISKQLTRYWQDQLLDKLFSIIEQKVNKK